MAFASLALLTVLAPPLLTPQGEIPQVRRPGVLQRPPTAVLQPNTRNIKISLFSMSYRKTDEGGKDEPYLVNVGFRFGIAHDLRGFYIFVPSIKAELVGTPGQNNLGHPEDQWATAGKRYPFTGHDFTASVPMEGSIDVVGMATMLMEEDGFNAAQVRRLREDFRWRIQSSIEEYARKTSTGRIYFDDFVRPLLGAVSSVTSGPLYPSLAPMGGGDPDEMGGTNAVFVFNFGLTPTERIPRQGVRLLSGRGAVASSLDYKELTLGPGNQAVNFAFVYPTYEVSTMVPRHARYTGEARIAGYATRDR